MALASKHKLGGFVILAGWIPNQEQLFKEAEKRGYINQKTPTLFCHGDADEWVPHWLGKEHFNLFRQKGYSANFISNRGLNHKISDGQIWDAGWFLNNTLNLQNQYKLESSRLMSAKLNNKENKQRNLEISSESGHGSSSHEEIEIEENIKQQEQIQQIKVVAHQ